MCSIDLPSRCCRLIALCLAGLPLLAVASWKAGDTLPELSGFELEGKLPG